MLNEQDVTNKRSYITQIFSAAFIVIGVVYFEYMSRLFVERGIYADEHQTSGYTTMLEFLGLFGSAALIIFGLTVFFVVWRQRVVKNKSTQSFAIRWCNYWRVICNGFIPFYYLLFLPSNSNRNM